MILCNFGGPYLSCPRPPASRHLCRCGWRSRCSAEVAPAEGAAPAGPGRGRGRAFLPNNTARAPPGRRGLAAFPAGPPLAPPRRQPRCYGLSRASPRGPGKPARQAGRPLSDPPAPRGRKEGRLPPLFPLAPGAALLLPPPLRGVGRAAADLYFGAGWRDVTAETRAAPGTGAGGGGHVSGHLAAAADGGGGGAQRPRPPPRRRVPRGGGGKWAPSRRSGPWPLAWACARAGAVLPAPLYRWAWATPAAEEPGSAGRLGDQACPQ